MNHPINQSLAVSDARELAPVEHRRRWIASGLLLQLAGVGAPAALLLERAKKDSVFGQITRYTVRLALHEALRSPSDTALLAAGLIAFVCGSVLLARPFVKRRSTLLVAITIAAVVGVLALGVIALACAAVIALLVLLGESELEGTGAHSGGSSKGREQKREEANTI